MSGWKWGYKCRLEVTHFKCVHVCPFRTGSLPVLQPLRKLGQVTRCVAGIIRCRAAGTWLELVIKMSRWGLYFHYPERGADEAVISAPRSCLSARMQSPFDDLEAAILLTEWFKGFYAVMLALRSLKGEGSGEQVEPQTWPFSNWVASSSKEVLRGGEHNITPIAVILGMVLNF